jgi:hypothetical protein
MFNQFVRRNPFRLLRTRSTPPCHSEGLTGNCQLRMYPEIMGRAKVYSEVMELIVELYHWDKVDTVAVHFPGNLGRAPPLTSICTSAARMACTG